MACSGTALLYFTFFRGNKRQTRHNSYVTHMGIKMFKIKLQEVPAAWFAGIFTVNHHYYTLISNRQVAL
jgi:hypothetical protein